MTKGDKRDAWLSEQAAGWLMRLEEEPSEDCYRAFLAWIESPRHVEEFLLVTAMYREVSRKLCSRQT